MAAAEKAEAEKILQVKDEKALDSTAQHPAVLYSITRLWSSRGSSDLCYTVLYSTVPLWSSVGVALTSAAEQIVNVGASINVMHTHAVLFA